MVSTGRAQCEHAHAPSRTHFACSPFVPGPELAIDRTPAPVWWSSRWSSSSNLPPQTDSPPRPVPVGSPPWIMKPGMMRWNYRGAWRERCGIYESPSPGEREERSEVGGAALPNSSDRRRLQSSRPLVEIKTTNGCSNTRSTRRHAWKDQHGTSTQSKILSQQPKTHNRAVIIASPGQLHEIVAGFGGVRGVELQGKRAQGGGDLDASHEEMNESSVARNTEVSSREPIAHFFTSATQLAAKKEKGGDSPLVCSLAQPAQLNGAFACAANPGHPAARVAREAEGHNAE